MKKIISYTCIIGFIWSSILFSILSRAGTDYAQMQRVVIALVFIFPAVLLGLWCCKPVFGIRNKKKRIFISRVLLSLSIGLFSVVASSAVAMIFLSDEGLYFLVLENPYIASSLVAGSLTAYLSLSEREV